MAKVRARRGKNRRSPAKQNRKKSAGQRYGPLHRWRACPLGQHWTKEHPAKVTPSEKHPDGKTIVRGHCKDNPSRKDQLYPEEMQYMAQQFFKGLSIPCAAREWTFDKVAERYEDLIRGWTQYWNDILEPNEPLELDIVRALIASESSFNPEVEIPAGKEQGRARGLMQITDGSRKILGDTKGELKDHFVHITDKEAFDPNLNICAVVRWLFRKKDLASVRLKDEATWVEAAYEYKGILRKAPTKERKGSRSQKEKNIFDRYYNELRNQKK